MRVDDHIERRDGDVEHRGRIDDEDHRRQRGGRDNECDGGLARRAPFVCHPGSSSMRLIGTLVCGVGD
jgi:hypothetical protein